MKVNLIPKMDNNNGWLQLLPPLPVPRRAQGEIKADYAIIGAGFTGLAAARRLAELRPDASIALLDAGRVGNNAAGRCSGFAIDQAHNIRAKNFSDGLEAERQQITINRIGQDFLRDAVQASDISCEWDEGGKIHAAATARGQEKLKAYAGHLDLLGAPYRWIKHTEMKRITGSEFYSSGMHTPGTILIQPAALVRGLAEHLPNNVILYENSAVTRVDYGAPHIIQTDSANIKTKDILLANNGFASQFGFYNKHLIPIITWGSLSRQLNKEELARLKGAGSWGIIPADPFGTSVRKTIGGRILIRNIYSYSRGLNAPEADRLWAQKKHNASLRNRFPMLPEVGLEFTWGGALSMSRNGETVFGTLADNVHGAFCLNGVGIARGTAYGKLLAEHVVDHSSGLLELMRAAGRPDKLPPRPFLGWGVRANFAKRRYDAGLEL